MALEELRGTLSEAETHAKNYADRTGAYYKLKAFKFLMQGIVSMTKTLLVGAVIMGALLFLSLAAGFGMGQYLNNLAYGFLCVGAVYALLALLVYMLRHKLEKPIIKKFSEYYFDD